MNDEVIARLNNLTPEEAKAQFLKCCGAEWWCDQMVASRPYSDVNSLRTSADNIFDSMPRDGWLTAFASHPKIGDLESLRMKFAGNKQWSAGEQAGISAADEDTIQRLAAGNLAYEQRFGYIFIVCATGKSAAEMLSLLEARLQNDETSELTIAAGEQRKITHLRLEKLISDL